MRRKIARALLWYSLGILACLIPMLPDGCAPPTPERVYVPLAVVSRETLGHWVGASYPDQCADANSLDADGVYNWGKLECEQIMTARMVFCTDPQPEIGDAAIILWGNEPDNSGQCDKTPGEFAAYWNATVTPLLSADRLDVSPAVYTLEWMQEWWDLIEIKPDAIAVHCYDYGGGNVCKDHILSFAQFGVPLLVTEWAYVPQQGEEQIAAAYLFDMLHWFDQHRDTVIMDAYFQTRNRGDEPWALFGNTSLLDWETHQLTPMGQAFRAYQRGADVNADGCVDILDITTVAGAFGIGCGEEVTCSN